MKTALLIIIGFFTLPFYGIGFIPLIWGLVRLFGGLGSKFKNVEGLDKSDENVFRWKALAVYPDQGVFTFNGKKFNISDVRNVEYQQTSKGFTGGGLARFDISLNNMKTPLLTLRSFGATQSDIRKQFQRLCIALDCDQRIR